MSHLFSPFRIGSLALKHRVVMAPLTRSRATTPGDLASDMSALYYSQRASEGGLVIAEASPVSASGRGWFGAPGMYSAEQQVAWTAVTRAVHDKGGSIFAQLWHTGRSSHIDVTQGSMPVSASVDERYWQDPDHLVSTPSGWQQPSPHRALSLREIRDIVGDYRHAAALAKAAGFDGVELHAANGYLLDQFLQDISNRRTDEYGGSVERRARLLLEVADAVASVWGADRVGVRIGPDGKWNGMGDSDPRALFDHVARALDLRKVGYLHVIEPRVKGSEVVIDGQGPIASEHLRTVFGGTIIAAGGFRPESAEAVVEKGDADLVAFGRLFISNPDLPARIRDGLPLAAYDRSTFFTFDARGYVDYPAFEGVS